MLYNVNRQNKVEQGKEIMDRAVRHCSQATRVPFQQHLLHLACSQHCCQSEHATHLLMSERAGFKFGSAHFVEPFNLLNLFKSRYRILI